MHGWIRALPFGWLLLVLACSPTAIAPTAPSTVAPQPAVDGVWQLTFRMTACTGERHCAMFIGTTREASLRLVRTGPIYAGVVTVFGTHVIVSGETTPDGELALSGRKAPVTATDQEVEVTTLRLRLAEGSTTGVLEYVVRGMPIGAFFFGDVRHAGQITNAQRLADTSTFDQTRFSGSWRGRFAVKQCSFAGWLWCYPYRESEVHSFTLELSQAGNDVVGTFTLGPTVIPLSGTVVGGVLELRGESSRAISGGFAVERLTAWSSQRDLAGSMTGSFKLELTWPGLGDGTRLYSTTYHSLELVSTALVN